jgi:hypothetical protein
MVWAGKVKLRGRNQKAVSALPRKSLRGRKSASVSDQQFEERLRIAERLVQALRGAGYSCELGDDGPARALKPLN